MTFRRYPADQLEAILTQGLTAAVEIDCGSIEAAQSLRVALYKRRRRRSEEERLSTILQVVGTRLRISPVRTWHMTVTNG